MSFPIGFNDLSTPGPSGPITAWAWDFHDGGTSTDENPIHSFSTSGNHTVTLTIVGSGTDGSATTTQTINVINTGTLAAAFSTSASALVVTFTDLSIAGQSGPITGWSWNFGDGNTSTSENPVHTYTGSGSYNVTLTVTGTSPDGTSAITQPVTVVSSGTGPAWKWDATTATVDPSSASKVASFLTYCGPLAYFFIEVSHATVTTHSPTSVYTVSTAGKVGALDATLYVPNGTLGGLSNDQHLWIEDQVSGRWHDLDGVSFTNGKLSNWRFGSSMPANSINVPRVAGKTNQGATAAMFPLARGTVTPAEAASGTIPHALVFTAANLGPAPDPYPSPPGTPGYASGNLPSGSSVTGHIPLGTWMRLNPSATLPGGATSTELMIFNCLKQYGMFCRDRGSDFSLHGQDPNGGGSSIPTWKSAGVSLGTNGVLHLGNIPWSQLQVLESPPLG